MSALAQVQTQLEFEAGDDYSPPQHELMIALYPITELIMTLAIVVPDSALSNNVRGRFELVGGKKEGDAVWRKKENRLEIRSSIRLWRE